MNRLTQKNFSFQCPMNWNEMEPSANGRFCNQCKKEVFDLTNCSLDEVRALQQKHGPICGSVRVAQVAAMAISLSAAACKEKQVFRDHPPHITGTVAAPLNPTTGLEPKPGEQEPQPQETPVDQLEPPILMGKIAAPQPDEDSKAVDNFTLRGRIAPIPTAKPGNAASSPE